METTLVAVATTVLTEGVKVPMGYALMHPVKPRAFAQVDASKR